MICPHCGSNNKEGTVFCGKCGGKMPDISDLFSDSSPSVDNSSSSTITQSTKEAESNDEKTDSTTPTYTYDYPNPNTLQSKANTLQTETNTLPEDTSKINIDDKKTDIDINFDNPLTKNKVTKAGFSKVLSTPEFIEKHKEYNLKMFALGLLAMALPIVILYIYSEYDTKLDTNAALILGLIFSLSVPLLYVPSFLRKSFVKSWEGLIYYKDSEIRTYSHKGHTSTYEVFVLKIRKNSGDSTSIEERSKDSYYYKNFKVGDRIKYPASIDYYEKYDKTKDKELLCPFCSTVSSITSKKCKKCGTPLIK